MIFLFLLLISPLRVLIGSPQPSSPSSPQVRRRHGALTMVGWGGVSNAAISSHHPHPHSPSQRPLVLGPHCVPEGLDLHKPSSNIRPLLSFISISILGRPR